MDSWAPWRNFRIASTTLFTWYLRDEINSMPSMWMILDLIFSPSELWMCFSWTTRSSPVAIQEGEKFEFGNGCSCWSWCCLFRTASRDNDWKFYGQFGSKLAESWRTWRHVVLSQTMPLYITMHFVVLEQRWNFLNPIKKRSSKTTSRWRGGAKHGGSTAKKHLWLLTN